jgi:ribosomal protein S2
VQNTRMNSRFQQNRWGGGTFTFSLKITNRRFANFARNRAEANIFQRASKTDSGRRANPLL